MKKLIKRLEELAVENERLSTENSEFKKRLRKHEPRIVGHEWFVGDLKDVKIKGRLIYDGEDLLQEENKVFNELDKDEEIIRHPFTVVVEVAKDFANKIQEVSDALKINDSQDFKRGENKELEEAIDILKDWNFGKHNYLSTEIDRAIFTILTHLEK